MPDNVSVLVLRQSGQQEASQQLVTVKTSVVCSNPHRRLQPLCNVLNTTGHYNLLQPQQSLHQTLQSQSFITKLYIML